jgi:hypothetical protein
MSSSIDRVINTALNSLQHILFDRITDWLQAHPLINWLVIHPRIGVIAVLVAVVLLWGLLGALTQLLQRAWIAVLNAPVRLAWWLILRIGHFLRSQWLVTIAHDNLDGQSPQQRFDAIAQRLDDLRHEQDELLNEMRSLLTVTPARPTHPKSPNPFG